MLRLIILFPKKKLYPNATVQLPKQHLLLSNVQVSDRPIAKASPHLGLQRRVSPPLAHGSARLAMSEACSNKPMRQPKVHIGAKILACEGLARIRSWDTHLRIKHANQLSYSFGCYYRKPKIRC